MAKFTKTNNKVSFFKIAQSKYNELLNATEGSEIGIIAGAIYFVEDGNVGRIYVDKKCYGEANLSNSVTNVTLENEGENAGKIKVTYSTGDPTYIPLPEGKVYTAGKGIAISASDEISALDEEIGSEIKVTQAVGALATNKTFDATTKLKDILKQMLQKEMQPTVTQPSVSLTFASAKAYEVGTKITPSYSAKLNAGSYSYGPATGITATSYAVTDTNGGSASTQTGSFTKFTVSDSTNYSVSATVNYGNGNIPTTYLGKEYAAGQIKAGSKTAKSSSVTPFRYCFWGYKGASNLISPATGITAAQIKALGNKNSSAPNSLRATDMQQIFVAVPSRLGYTSMELKDTGTGLPVTVNGSVTVQVGGLNDYSPIDYTVFYSDNAAAAPGTTTYSITLAK